MALRGAIIGLGNVAMHGHLPGWLARRDVALVAATDTVSAREDELRDRLPHARWYASVDALLTEEVLDFVDICTPPATHAGLIQAALDRGLHVLCEKPLVSRIEDLGPLVDLAGKANRVLHTVHNWLQAPVIRKVGELLRQGAIGEIQECVWHTLRNNPAVTREALAGNWRVDPAMAGGGVLVDHGWHAFYIVHAWLNQQPSRISARLETRRHTEWPIEDTATVRLEFPAGTAEVFLTWASDVRRNWAKLEGTRGTVQVEDDAVLLIPSGSQGRAQRWKCPPALSSGSFHPDWFGGVAKGFVEAMTGSSTERDGNLADASMCAVLVALAQESDRQGGRSIPVPGPSPLVAARVSGKAPWNR